jgi:hypothetical protein
MGEQDDDDLVEGWKDIAEELGGVSVRTAQRYRRKHGLPVKTDITGAYAYRSALRRWAAGVRGRGQDRAA